MDLKLPHLGEGADSGTVVNLFVKEGDQVAKDQAILELENEKAVATIPSTAAGKVTEIFVKTGDKISVGQRLLSLSESGETPAAKPAKAKAAAKAPEQRQDSETEENDREESADGDDGEPPTAETTSSAGVAASPSLRKMARDLGIDLTRVRGSE